MLHNQFEIDGAWQEGTVTSRKGDVAHMRINSVSKEVWIKTRVGDGNFSDWRRTNTTYEATIAQGFVPLAAVSQTLMPALVPVDVTPPGQDQADPAKLDLESVAPFGKRSRKVD